MKTDNKYDVTWLIAMVIGVLGILGHLVALPFITAYSFALVVAAFVIYALRPVLDDLMHA